MKNVARRPASAVLSVNAPTVYFNKTAKNRQDQAHAATTAFCVSVDLVETVEDTFGEVRGYTWPIICDPQMETTVVRIQAVVDRDRDSCIAASIAPGIFQYVAQHHFDTPPVNINEGHLLRHNHLQAVSFICGYSLLN